MEANDIEGKKQSINQKSRMQLKQMILILILIIFIVVYKIWPKNIMMENDKVKKNYRTDLNKIKMWTNMCK